MVREKKTPQQEEEAELDRALFFLPSHEAEEIRAFRKSLKSLGREGKARRYLEKRDDLLRRHAGLDLLFGCYWPLFKQDRSCHKQQDEAWEEFESQSREAHKRIKCVLTIASIWGKEVVLYYRLFSEGRRYCDKIRTVAKAFPRWEKATAVLNYAIHQRLQKRDLDKRTPEGRKGVNPIENYDLDLIKGIVDRVANNSSRLPEDLSLPLSKIPQGYHLDDYGLIVRDTVLPRQSVTHQDDNALALTASTPVPIPRNLSSKSASHLPNGPTGSNTKTPTSSSRPLFASAWLSALPLYKLEEGECIDDSIVNAYMYTISAEHPEICFLNSHFLNQYNGDMKKWRPEIGKHPLQADFVLMPVHENHHWYLLVMFKRAPVGINADGLTVCVLDSLGMTHEETFKCWENYLAVCGNKSRIQKIDVEVPQQINSIDCGIYMLGFVREFLQNPQQFTEAVDRGQHLDWEIHASALRQEIRAILVAARDATVNRDDTHTDSGHEDLGSDHGLVEIAGSPGDNIGNDGKDRKEGDNKESNSVVGPRVAPCSISPAASSKHTSPSAFVGEWAISLARLGRTDTGSAESFEIPFRNPSARTLVDQVSEPGKQIVEDRLFTFFTMLLDQEHIGRRALFKAVLRALERVDHNRPAEQVDLALRVATSGDGQVLEEASSTTAGRTKKRKHGMDAKGITMPTSKYPRNGT
ncbi:hypothetical protein F5Y16DRAFT_139786 [Xylariaceae sp. FL0255]|nr:hypothetical protein F5Y16DRAFT_139786 [Xylariaceae sp. FL0255]